MRKGINKKELPDFAKFLLKKYFDSIPYIPCRYVSHNRFDPGTSAQFLMDQGDNYNMEDDELYNAEGYRGGHIDLDGDMLIGVDVESKSWTDPANHPKLRIEVSDELWNLPLYLTGSLLHELAHYWCWHTGREYHDGNDDFEAKLKELGLPSNYDRKFNKKTKQWEDDFDYEKVAHYYDEFRASGG